MSQPTAKPELLEDIFNSPPVYNAILACLSPADIIRVGRTCRLLRGASESFQSLAYNINRHLEHFVKNPIALRRIQARTKFLISGSNALQFFDRTYYPASDLDIFAYPETSKEIGYHLIKEEGYVFGPSEKQAKKFEDVVVKERNWDRLDRGFSQEEFVYNSGMSDLLKFKHPESGLEIQLIGARRCPLDCILYFHSTCVMNIITHDTAYAFYPKATFDNRIALKFGYDEHPATKKAYRKYSGRGWTFVEDLTYEAVKGISAAIGPDETRYLDDKFTWRIPLGTTDLQTDTKDKSKAVSTDPGSDEVDPFVCNSWSLARNFTGYSTTMTFGISYRVHHSGALEGTYLVADSTMSDAIDMMVDYLERYNPSRKNGRKYVDSYLPALRVAHAKTPKRVHWSEK